MSEMRQRLRAALQLRAAKYGDPMEDDNPIWDDFIEAVWATLRAPTPEMIAAYEPATRRVQLAPGYSETYPNLGSYAEGNWRRMIDAALSNQSPTSGPVEKE